jgi:hypothetical protein
VFHNETPPFQRETGAADGVKRHLCPRADDGKGSKLAAPIALPAPERPPVTRRVVAAREAEIAAAQLAPDVPCAVLERFEARKRLGVLFEVAPTGKRPPIVMLFGTTTTQGRAVAAVEPAEPHP